MPKTHKFTADWTYRTPLVTIDYPARTETPLSAEVLRAATSAGVIEGAKGDEPVTE